MLKFLGPQFKRLGARDADAGLQHAPLDEAAMLCMLRWLLVQIIVSASSSVAVSAVTQLPKDADAAMRDHACRFENVTTFEQSVRDFVIVTDGALDIVSLRNQDLLSTIAKRYPECVPLRRQFMDVLRMQGLDKPTNPVQDLRRTLGEFA